MCVLGFLSEFGVHSTCFRMKLAPCACISICMHVKDLFCVVGVNRRRVLSRASAGEGCQRLDPTEYSTLSKRTTHASWGRSIGLGHLI